MRNEWFVKKRMKKETNKNSTTFVICEALFYSITLQIAINKNITGKYKINNI